MKLIPYLATIIIFFYSSQAYIYHVFIETGLCHPFYLKGKTTVKLHGPFNKKEIVFEKELISSYGGLVRRNIDFPDRQILKAVVTWNTKNKDDIGVKGAYIYNKITQKEPVYLPTNGTTVTLKNGDSVTLVRDD